MKDDPVQQAIDVLNRALETDPVAVQTLFRHRVSCNEGLCEDPTIQVDGQGHTVGVLGLINGLFGIRPDGWGHVTAVVDTNDGSIERFELTSATRG